MYLYKDGKISKVGTDNLYFTDIQRVPTGELFFGRFVETAKLGWTKYEVYRQNPDGTFKLFLKKDHTSLEMFESAPYDFYTGHYLETFQYFIPKGQKGVFKPVKNQIPECVFELGSFYETHSCDFNINQEGYIWANSGKGLWQIYPTMFEPLKNKAIENIGATEIIEDQKQNIYFSTLPILKYDGSKFESIDAPTTIFYFGASSDNKGNVYFPHHYGVLKYDGKQFSQLFPKENRQSDRDYYECSFYDKRRNWLLMGGYRQVKILDLTKNTMQTITPIQGLHESADTEGMFNDSTDNSIWIFGKQGITNWQPETNRFKNYSLFNERGLSFGGVSGCIDAHGTVWIGNTFGLGYFDRKKDEFNWVSKELKHYFTAVMNYGKEHLILGTAESYIYLFDLKTWYENKKVALRLFNDTNGYQFGKIQHGGIFKDSKNVFWFLSTSNVSRLSPKNLDLSQNERPKVYIKQIDTINVHLNHTTDTISLKYGQNYFNIESGTIFFTPSVKTYFSYRLIGMTDTTWSVWTETANNLFTNLSSDIYKLEIKARPLGYNETAVDTVYIKVDLPLLNEPWFQKAVLGLLSLVLLILAFVGFRNWYLRRQLEKNTILVRHLEIQTLQSQMNPHFIYNILGSMQNVIYQNDTETANTLLLNLSKLIRRFLEASVRSNNFQKLNIQNETTLREEIDLLKLYIEFEQFVRKDKFTYDITVTKNIDVENFTLPPIIIQPYVENAIKHGIFYKKEKGHLALNFYKQDEETLVCEIIDDGVGIERAKEMQAKSIKSYKSLSTQLILERIERLNLMGYNIVVKTENRREGGTKVHITFAYAEL